MPGQLRVSLTTSIVDELADLIAPCLCLGWITEYLDRTRAYPVHKRISAEHFFALLTALRGFSTARDRYGPISERGRDPMHRKCILRRHVKYAFVNAYLTKRPT